MSKTAQRKLSRFQKGRRIGKALTKRRGITKMKAFKDALKEERRLQYDIYCGAIDGFMSTLGDA
jgi:hypothetical protein